MITRMEAEEGKIKGFPHFPSPANRPPTPVNRPDLPCAALTGLYTDEDRALQRNKITKRERREVASRPCTIGLSSSLKTQHPPSDFSLASCLVSSLCLCPVSLPVEPLLRTVPARPRCNGVKKKEQEPSDLLPLS